VKKKFIVACLILEFIATVILCHKFLAYKNIEYGLNFNMANIYKIIFLSVFITFTLDSSFAAVDETPDIPSLESVKSHASCIANINECKDNLKLTSGDESANFPIYVSRGSDKIEKVIVVLHGTERNADEYLRDLIANIDSPLLKNTAVVAPHFLQVNDSFEAEELRWNQGWTNSWKYGFKSGAPLSISSFEVMDRLIKNIDESWHPGKIILAGHSAGGQFVQRYAHGTRIDYDINSNLSFVVSNPSSYLYNSDKRLIDGKWERPVAVECAEYDSYIYGLKDRNEYLNQLSRDALKKNYIANNVYYLMGEEDIQTDDLDESCEANFQGTSRIDRARNFFIYLNKFFPGHKHKFLPVPKVGHDHIKMFSSQPFIDLLLDKNKVKSNDSLTISRVGNKDVGNKKPEALYFLNGGGANIDAAFIEFLKSLKGGDLVILSGKDDPLDYNEYFVDLAKQNSIALNSVTTILIHSRLGASDQRLVKLINQSEGIFFSGGDQWKYVERMRNSASLKAVNEKVRSGIPFGGTSAGLAILGDIIFSAEKGSVSSDEVMSDPMSEKITLEHSMFNLPQLTSVLTDTHFVMRDRMGRLLSFLGRGYKDTQNIINGLGVDEGTVLIINKAGNAKVMGSGAIYLVRPTTIPEMGESFNWNQIQVNRWAQGTSFSWNELKDPDYFYDIQNGELFSTQEDGEIY
jgi:cyanophycinase